MDKNTFALTPPMGWNSYDYYNTSADEQDIRKNAEYMAQHLKKFGWEYVVIDIEWYSCHGHRMNDEYQYIPYEDMAMDEYSRLLPCEARFPSAAGGRGFKPLADYIHSLGLKFGIHIMRGIPRIAAHRHCGILNTDVTANEIAEPNNICFWNPDMYGVNPKKPASQLYYDSIFALYAEWGVDFVKCDDICRLDMPTAKEEIRMLHRAIEHCGRDIVLSLSPGAAKIEEAWLYEQNSNMWRITDDFWDDWKALVHMFERCEVWQKHVTPGNYPDCDMLPVGKIGGWHFGERDTNFTRDEQITMMTLWSIFRAPMMIGADLPQLDEWTRKLLTNRDVLHVLNLPNQAMQLVRTDKEVIWLNTEDAADASGVGETVVYIALFNLRDEESIVTLHAEEHPELTGLLDGKSSATELWTGETVPVHEDVVSAVLPAHGAALLRI
ncbi:MAG: glycoside hydrolase family 27 protein [Lachnospiraceae bacterium]